MKMSLFLSFLLLVLIAGTSEPFTIFIFGAGLLSLGRLIRKQQNMAHWISNGALVSTGRLQE